MGLFSKLFGQSDKIKVQFIDNYDGKTIGVSEMLTSQLPDTFSIKTTMHIKNIDWAVEEAIPENSIDFIKSKSLVLRMRKIERMPPGDFLFTLSSISNEFPGTSDKALFNNFEVLITEDEWRQNEFLNRNSLPLIDVEISKINDIRENHNKKLNDSMMAFTKCHVRDAIGSPDLRIDFTALKEMLKVDNVGSLKLINNDGFVLNGFTLITSNTTFYGTLLDGLVIELGISNFSDLTIDEIQNVTKTFDLIFVNWYHCDIVMDND